MKNENSMSYEWSMRALDTLGQLQVDQNGWTNGDGVRDERENRLGKMRNIGPYSEELEKW